LKNDISKITKTAMAERPCELGNIKEVGHFEAIFQIVGLHFALISMDH